MQDCAAACIGHTGVVVIGRNEGAGLRESLAAIALPPAQIVYVDSGSTDDSVAIARASGAAVIELDASRPFTAARGRNAGLQHFIEKWPSLQYIQFVDGDSLLEPGWLEQAYSYLQAEPQVAAVCGRLRERNPDASIYHRLAAIEWDVPPGPTAACGGNAMYRASAIVAEGGFDESMPGGEEPDLCFRLRKSGWQIVRLDAPMAVHDIGPMTFRDWWRRSKRAGQAFAQAAWRYRNEPGRPWVREALRDWFWAGLVPLAFVLALWLVGAIAVLILLLYVVAIIRPAWRQYRSGTCSVWTCLAYGGFVLLGKFAGLQGQVALAARSNTASPKSAPVCRT